jgi:hypothetical protein
MHLLLLGGTVLLSASSMIAVFVIDATMPPRSVAFHGVYKGMSTLGVLPVKAEVGRTPKCFTTPQTPRLVG